MGERGGGLCARQRGYRKGRKDDRFRCICRACVDALLHVSQISRAHVDKPSDVLSVGQEITARVVDLNESDKKISLSMKVLESASEDGAEEGLSEE